MNIFSEIPYSFAGVKQYQDFLKNKRGRVVLYAFLVVLVYTLIAQMRTVPDTFEFASNAKEMLENTSEFEMDSGKLKFGESIYFDMAGVYLSIDTSYGSYINAYTEQEWKDEFEGYAAAMAFDESTMLTISGDEIYIYDYPEWLSFTKDTIEWFLNMLYLLVFVYLFFAYLFSVGGYFLGALFVALVGLIIDANMKNKLTFGQIYVGALYAKTLPVLIKGILKLGAMGTFVYSIFGFAIACVYLGMAMRHMNKTAEENIGVYTKHSV